MANNLVNAFPDISTNFDSNAIQNFNIDVKIADEPPISDVRIEETTEISDAYEKELSSVKSSKVYDM